MGNKDTKIRVTATVKSVNKKKKKIRKNKATSN